MGDKSAIEWTDATWNPVTGCTRVSPGCAHCYIERTPPFRMQGRRFEQPLVDEWVPPPASLRKPMSTTGVRLHPERLEQPLRWKRPRRIFVCSLADLFHDTVPDGFIAEVFATMEAASQHTFQVLTKRPERALAWFGEAQARWRAGNFDLPFPVLRNVWLGVSIENARYTWRADVLRQIPATVRFISAEPLLGSLLTDPHIEPRRWRGGHWDGYAALDLTGIDWVIVGGESGPGARPMHPEWARELRDACLGECACGTYGYHMGHCPPIPHMQERTAFFFKQWGEWAPELPQRHREGDPSLQWVCDAPRPSALMHRLGKKRAGRLLDGRTWDETPWLAGQEVMFVEDAEEPGRATVGQPCDCKPARLVGVDDDRR